MRVSGEITLRAFVSGERNPETNEVDVEECTLLLSDGKTIDLPWLLRSLDNPQELHAIGRHVARAYQAGEIDDA